jgi:hypothetical protein
MYSKQVQENNQRIKSRIKQYWTKLSEDEVNCYEFRRELFFLVVQMKYGVSKQQVEDVLFSMEHPLREVS